MTGRTGAGVGMITTVVLTSVAAVGFFVSTLLLLGQKNDAERRASEADQRAAEIVNAGERNSDVVRQMVNDAKKDGNRSLVGYLNASMGALAEKVGGAPGDTLRTLASKVEAKLGRMPGTKSLLGALDERDRQIALLEKRVTDANAQASRASEDLQGALAQVKTLRDEFASADKVRADQVGTYTGKIDDATKKMAQRVTELTAEIEQIRKDAGAERTSLNDRIAKLSDEKLVLENKVKALTSERGGDLFKPDSEEALVDASIVRVDPDNGQVTLNRGRQDKLSVGMTFQVYGEASQIRIDPRTEEYVTGKAVVEIIRLDDKTATARVVRAVRGNPIAPGDVLMNPLYDPRKVYSFVIFGDFDPSGYGVPTPEGAAGIRNLIEQFGGKVTDTLGGGVDFLVLGERPTLPPQPPSTAPIEVLLAFREQQNLVKKYDDLFATAAATSTPVLSENRLYTLLGTHTGQRPR